MPGKVVAQSARQDTSRQTTGAHRQPDTTRLLYKGYGYGSDAYNTPFTVLLNKGYDIFQLRRSPRNFWTFSYRASFTHGIRDVFQHPGPAVERFGGWNRFTHLELLPMSHEFYELNWLANYTEHLIGGGLTMRMLDEWYDAHGVPLPRVMAVLTTYSASILNEISEQPDAELAGAGGVADLLFFDMGAIALFHWRQPTHFFAATLQAADWSNMASFTFPNRQLQNNGQYMTLKVPIGLERHQLFIRGGMGAQFGIRTRLSDNEHYFTVSAGGDTEVRDIDNTGHETIGMAPGAGIYYDRNNSLLWSFTTSPAENLLALNIYPGVIPRVKDFGVWGVLTRRNELRFGIVSKHLLGLGVGYGR